MIYNFQNFVNESTSKRISITFWNDNILKGNWSDFSIKQNTTKKNSYYLNIDQQETENSISIILDVIGDKENLLYVKPQEFWEKFKTEFGKKPSENLKKLEYIPQIIKNNFKKFLDATGWGIV